MIAAELGLSAATVRGWIRRACARPLRVQAVWLAHDVDSMLGLTRPSGSALGDALDALGRAVAAVVRQLGPIAPPWQLAALIAGGPLLAPLPSG